MKKGTVKFYNFSKGYGFINDSTTGEDIFVHSTGLKAEIRDGDEVTFEETPGKKGMNAVNVQLV